MSHSNHSNSLNQLSSLSDLKQHIPETGFDGLQELLLLADELELSSSDQDNSFISSFLDSAKEHLQYAPNTLTINSLLDSFKGLAVDLGLDDDDWAFLEANLMQDNAPESSTSKSKFTAQQIEQFIDQTQQFTSQATENGLSGLLDILLLIQDWCENQLQSPDAIIAEQSIFDTLTGALSDYISGRELSKAINTLFKTLNTLDESTQLEQDEIDAIAELLLQEAATLHSTVTDAEALEGDELTLANNCLAQLQSIQNEPLFEQLSGIQDIVYLLEEWLNTSIESNSVDQMGIKSCQQCLLAVTNYFTNQNSSDQIDTILYSINQLEQQPLIDEDDVGVIKQLLLDDTELLEQSPLVLAEESNQTTVTAKPQLQAPTVITDTSQVPQALQEFVALLLITLQPIVDSAYELINEQQAFASHSETLIEHLDKFSRIAETADFKGLHLASLHTLSNLNALQAGDKPEFIDALLEQWLVALNHYLINPTAPEKIQSLILALCSPKWPIALNEVNAMELMTAFQALESDNQQEAQPERQKQAQADDISLQVPEDVAPELVDSLLSELPEQTASFSAAIANLDQGGSMDDIIIAQRAAHTLKGAGNTVGVRGIANLTHHLEDILTALVNSNTLPSGLIRSTLQRASDCLEEISESLTTDSEPPQDTLSVLQEILDLAGRIDHEGIESLAGQAQVTPSTATTAKAADSKDAKEEKENTEQMLRIPASTIDSLLQFSDELMIANGQLRDQLKNALDQTRALKAHLDQFHLISEEMLDLVDLQSIKQLQTADTENPDFDSLEMDQYNELYTTSRRLHEMTSDSREMNRGFVSQLRDIDALVIEQGYLNGASRDQLLDMRTIPVNTITSRLQRSVRQAIRMTGKNAQLSITGQDVLVDRDILNGMLDPIMHLLRNAVDHGIEDPENRVATGKNEQGNIKLDFKRDKNMIVVDCIDDGAGLNLNAIKNKALKLGMIEPDTVLADDEIKQLIMQPNFSTQENVSHISGRGVGMDAVNTGIRALGGTLNIDSEAGQGCHFHIQLPLSLAHYNTLLVKIGSQTLAIAELGIDQILLPEAGHLSQEDQEYVFEFDDKRYTVKALESLLSRVQPNLDQEIQNRTLLLLSYQDQHYAIAVESVLNVKEMVVKELDSVLPKIHGVIGASLLDDGSIASVLDLQELLQQPARWGDQHNEQFIQKDQMDDLPHAMVVDDSLSARRSLEQFFSDMGYQIMPARDGLEAIELLDSRIPDIVITDLEMPRVNGIELTEHLRRTESTESLPVIMITSRATGKHKQLAIEKGVDVYLTKPYSEEELSKTVLDLFNQKQKIA